MRTKMFIVWAVLLAIPCFAKVTVQEYTMPAIQGFPFRPIVQGDWALALLNTEPNRINSTIGVLAYDLKAKKVFTLHQGKAGSPTISGTLAMWTGKISDIPKLGESAGMRGQILNSLILYDLSSGQYRTPALKTNSANYMAASGNYIAYEYSSKIYLYDLTTNAQRLISDSQNAYSCPDVGGDLVIWREYDSARKNARTIGYRISTGETITFEDFRQPIGAPHTDGAYVAWWDNARGSSIYEISTGKVRVIKSAVFPDVGGGFAVYVKYAGKDSSGQLRHIVYGMDLAAGEEFQISRAIPDPQSQFRIEGNRVVWVDGSTLHCADLTRTSELILSNK